MATAMALLLANRLYDGNGDDDNGDGNGDDDNGHDHGNGNGAAYGDQTWRQSSCDSSSNGCTVTQSVYCRSSPDNVPDMQFPKYTKIHKI